MCSPDSWFDFDDDNAGKTAGTTAATKLTSTCPAGYEERRIILAQGLQFRNKDMETSDRIPDGLTKLGLKVTAQGGDEFEYVADIQKICYKLRIVTTRPDFKKALEAPGVHLIYDGHARYGRGPCFGDYNFSWGMAKGEQWQNATGPSDKYSIFRMGMPYIGVPADEVDEHGYTPNLVPSSTKIKVEECDADLERFHGSIKAFKTKELHASLHLYTADKNPDTLWLGYKGDHDKMHVVHKAGWQKTISDPMDLGATKMACRVFCHFGCITLLHNMPVVRLHKPWPQKGDYQLAYWTSNSSYSFTTKWWLFHLFTYPGLLAFQPWEPHLKKYVVPLTNASIAAEIKAYNAKKPKEPMKLYKIV